jgi:hypothetical protein
MEQTDACKLFSVNVLRAVGPDADLLWINHGNQFYVREGGEIRNILVYENEPGRQFEYAIGFSVNNPLQEVRKLAQPCFVEAFDAPAHVRSKRHTDTTQSSWSSLFAFEKGTAELLSCRYAKGKLLVRVAALTGNEQEVVFNSPIATTQAYRTDLRGTRLEKLALSDGRISLVLRPWDIAQIELVLASGSPRLVQGAMT